jgi:hypothetical protein
LESGARVVPAGGVVVQRVLPVSGVVAAGAMTPLPEYGALLYNTSGSNNTATGYAAMLENTAGDDNTATGFQAIAHMDAMRVRLQADTVGVKNVQSISDFLHRPVHIGQRQDRENPKRPGYYT